VERKEVTVDFFDKIYCIINFEWIEGNFVNPPPFQLFGGGIPVLGVVKVRCKAGCNEEV